jgi:hypothetical protein
MVLALTVDDVLLCRTRVVALLCLLLIPALARSAAKPDTDLSWVEKRVQELEPTAKEKRFDEIGWAKDIREAQRLAKKNVRPVFLFTHDGHMNIGRC